MKTVIRGKCYVVGDDVDTDQIIPAQYLSYSLSVPEERKMYARYALTGVPEQGQGLPFGKIPFVREDSFVSDFKIVIGGKNFGCGSSREHASFCMREAGIEAVIAGFYSRIFFRNSVNGGYLIPFESMENLALVFKTGEERNRCVWGVMCIPHSRRLSIVMCMSLNYRKSNTILNVFFRN